MAESKGIILVAPTLDLSAAAERDVPIVFPRLVDDVAARWRVDRDRRYLFGYSGGGYFVFDAALLRSDYFAAGAVYASVIQPPYDSIAAHAPRKTHIAIYLSDHDQYLSLDQARRTRDLLEANGTGVRLVELANHDHEYGSIAATLNEDAWSFLSTYTLR